MASHLSRHLAIAALAAFPIAAGCAQGDPPAPPLDGPGEVDPTPPPAEAAVQRHERLALIVDAAARHGITNPVLLAGVAFHDSGGLNHCWSEARWGCPGPESPDCDGPVLAAPSAGDCSETGGLGMFALSAGTADETRAAFGDGVLTLAGNAEAGVQRVLDALYEDAGPSLGWTSRESMTAWINGAAPGTEAYEAWLDAAAAALAPCRGADCPPASYLRASYDAAVRELLATMGPKFWTQGQVASATYCACGGGTYHNGAPIPVGHTYCGMRVCGLDGVFECTPGGWSHLPGLACGAGDGCSCGGGYDHNGNAIDQATTACHTRACGLDFQFYTCEAGGWSGTGERCPTPAAGSCSCANGIDQNGQPIDPADTYCGFETCGVNGGHWQCTASGWEKLDNSCGQPAPSQSGFGYALGDRTTSPAGAGGWSVWQVLGHYWSVYLGVHLAQDVGKVGGQYEPVYSIADGVVRVSAPNSSTYKNVVLIEHAMADGSRVCSFYAHLDTRTVFTGQPVSRGDQIATVMHQGGNTHLHYVIMTAAACDHIASLGGGGMCGYDGAGPGNGVGHADLVNEPFLYTAVGTNPGNGCNIAGRQFYSPSKFIDLHHF